MVSLVIVRRILPVRLPTNRDRPSWTVTLALTLVFTAGAGSVVLPALMTHGDAQQGQRLESRQRRGGVTARRGHPVPPGAQNAAPPTPPTPPATDATDTADLTDATDTTDSTDTADTTRRRRRYVIISLSSRNADWRMQ
jgi:hypothetical protein